MTASDDAVRLLLLTAGGNGHADTRYHKDQCTRLAMQWPSLAAALADLLAAYEVPVPSPFRAAASVMRGEAASQPAQPTENGAWCFCFGGPNADGRGHLRGEAGCTMYCRCNQASQPHQHDGTMPGNPVIYVV